MALTTCPDCGKKISTSAEKCPECGRPMRMSRQGNAFNPFHDPVHFLGLIIALLMVAGVIAVAVSSFM